MRGGAMTSDEKPKKTQQPHPGYTQEDIDAVVADQAENYAEDLNVSTPRWPRQNNGRTNRTEPRP